MPKVTVHFTDRPAIVYTDCVAISREGGDLYLTDEDDGTRAMFPSGSWHHYDVERDAEPSVLGKLSGASVTFTVDGVSTEVIDLLTGGAFSLDEQARALHDYRRKVRSVECPLCGSAPGFECLAMTEPDAFVPYVHDDRSAAWERSQEVATDDDYPARAASWLSVNDLPTAEPPPDNAATRSGSVGAPSLWMDPTWPEQRRADLQELFNRRDELTEGERVTIDGHAYIVAKVTPVGVDIRLARDEPEPEPEPEPVAKVEVEMDAVGVHFTGYLTPEQIDGPLHTGLMTDAQLTQWMGTDATRWAAEFAKRFRSAFAAAWNDAASPLRDVIEELIDPAGGGMLHGWFANAIEHARGVGYDAGARNERDMAHQPVVAYQGNVFGTGDPGVIFVRVMAKDFARLRELVTWGVPSPNLPSIDVVKLAVDDLVAAEPTAESLARASKQGHNLLASDCRVAADSLTTTASEHCPICCSVCGIRNKGDQTRWDALTQALAALGLAE